MYIVRQSWSLYQQARSAVYGDRSAFDYRFPRNLVIVLVADLKALPSSKGEQITRNKDRSGTCLLYTSDAADE